VHLAAATLALVIAAPSVAARTLIRLEAPKTHEQGPNNDGTIAVGETPLTIDVLIAFSRADSIAGGFIVSGGQSNPLQGDVTIDLDGSDGQGQREPAPRRRRDRRAEARAPLKPAHERRCVSSRRCGTPAPRTSRSGATRR
jgi:hypothetical protein